MGEILVPEGIIKDSVLQVVRFGLPESTDETPAPDFSMVGDAYPIVGGEVASRPFNDHGVSVKYLSEEAVEELKQNNKVYAEIAAMGKEDSTKVWLAVSLLPNGAMDNHIHEAGREGVLPLTPVVFNRGVVRRHPDGSYKEDGIGQILSDMNAPELVTRGIGATIEPEEVHGISNPMRYVPSVTAFYLPRTHAPGEDFTPAADRRSAVPTRPTAQDIFNMATRIQTSR